VIEQSIDARGVVTLTLNRPDAFNALSEAMLHALYVAIEEAGGREATRIIIIAARGRAFCAGHDLKEMRANPSEDYYQRLFKRCSRVMMAIQATPVPVIAQVEGIATAAGCQLVAMCDLAVAARSARFAVRLLQSRLWPFVRVNQCSTRNWKNRWKRLTSTQRI